jgi:DNA-binding beta-propeller fold protein YncE
MRFLFSLVCFPAVLCAQSIAVPHSGITFDENSKTFRPVLGVAGAAILGDAFELRGDWNRVSVCSQQQFALAAGGRDGVVTILHLDSLKTNELSPALGNAPTLIKLSAGCSVAAIYYAPPNRLQIVTELPTKPTLSADLTLDLPGSVSDLAISEDGQLAVAVVPGKAVYAVPANGRPVSLLSIQQDAVVALRGNQDALVADRSINTVTLFANAAGATAASILAGPDDGIDAPSGVWFDVLSSSVVVANSGNGKVSLLPLAGGRSEIIACQCQLSGVTPLVDRTYQIQAPASNQPLRMLDLGASPPRITFVASPESPVFPKGRRD